MMTILFFVTASAGIISTYELQKYYKNRLFEQQRIHLDEVDYLLNRTNLGFSQNALNYELLDAYASAMVNAAKREPDGLGFIPQEDALIGRFKMPADERVADKEQEELLLITAVEELLRHELVLKEVTDAGTDLVFPSFASL